MLKVTVKINKSKFYISTPSNLLIGELTRLKLINVVFYNGKEKSSHFDKYKYFLNQSFHISYNSAIFEIVCLFQRSTLFLQ